MENRKLEQLLYLDNFIDIFSIETKIIEFISSSMNDNIILKQFKNSKIIKREATKAGYYCYLQCENNLEKSNNNGFLGNVSLILNNQNIGGGMIFLENGFLKMIECYFWDKSDFFEKLTIKNNIFDFKHITLI